MSLGNYPPGVSDEDIEREFGDEPSTCGNCAHCLLRACDLDPCERGGGVESGMCEVMGSYVWFMNWCDRWEES